MKHVHSIQDTEELLSRVITAHGGAARWNNFKKLQATVVTSGQLFDIKGFPQDPHPRTMTVHLHEQYASRYPFGGPDLKTNFTPGRVAIETLEGMVINERTGTPASIHKHMEQEQWDALDRANFNGYAMWTYLTTPFFLLMPGIKAVETAPYREGKETWRVLEVTFPSTLATHSTIQHFYFGDDHLLRRHDYTVDIAGVFEAAQYVYDPVEAQGIWLPTKRRAYKKGPGGNPLLNELMISIDIQKVHFF